MTAADHTPSPTTDGLLTEHDRNDLLLGHHDGLCPEGPDCQSRWLHAQSPTIYASLTPTLLATFEGILADRIARAVPAAHPAPPSETATEGVTRVEWGVQKRAYPLGQGLRLYRDDETAARESAPRVIGSGAYVVRRTVTTYAPIVGEWEPVEETQP